MDEGRGRPAAEDVTTEEGDLDRKAEEEGGAGSSRGRGGASRFARDFWSFGRNKLRQPEKHRWIEEGRLLPQLAGHNKFKGYAGNYIVQRSQEHEWAV